MKSGKDIGRCRILFSSCLTHIPMAAVIGRRTERELDVAYNNFGTNRVEVQFNFGKASIWPN